MPLPESRGGAIQAATQRHSNVALWPPGEATAQLVGKPETKNSGERESYQFAGQQKRLLCH
jgi:hypothetical protein